ncbi:hypothetical protein G9C98_006855 [Cotesia typhae]|uniref:Uncharacterized protein n=1 Tax=Cotesia typhae TaxID=2053667 RepID=A0A8J5RA96_9HYME|nr:hypothetical protein G9C98_006855 [Cotesia typhae]
MEKPETHCDERYPETGGDFCARWSRSRQRYHLQGHCQKDKLCPFISWGSSQGRAEQARLGVWRTYQGSYCRWNHRAG